MTNGVVAVCPDLYFGLRPSVSNEEGKLCRVANSFQGRNDEHPASFMDTLHNSLYYTGTNYEFQWDFL